MQTTHLPVHASPCAKQLRIQLGLPRSASRACVLEAAPSDCSDSESDCGLTSPDRRHLSSPPSSVAPSISSPASAVASVMTTIASAARSNLPLPAPAVQLVQMLFPSALSISATVRSADGLGMAVVQLLAGRQQQQQQLQQQRPKQQAVQASPQSLVAASSRASHHLTQPLADGGVLSFSLTEQPQGAELQLMRAFALELSSRLQPRQEDPFCGKALGPFGAPACLPGLQQSGMPLDCFWAPF